MIKIQQFKDGVQIYEDDRDSYNYNIHQFIQNGAIKITIEYPRTTIIVTPQSERTTNPGNLFTRYSSSISYNVIIN
jgi:hypothetical protein